MTSSGYKKIIYFSLSFLLTMSGIVSVSAAVKPIVIVLDAGHGGKDPGALGPAGLKEKEVNLDVVRRLHKLLANNPNFKPEFTRDGDYFISVSRRSDIARRKGADMLISIHADAALNSRASGASVWVLSNKRADTELGRLLEQQEKQSELLGGSGEVLTGEVDPYLSQTVIDLQFAHAQRTGYAIAQTLLTELTTIGALHRRYPEHASFGILRSPDIPSVLVEVGFISSKNQEKQLKTESYRQKIALAIYQGICRYYQNNEQLSVVSNTPPEIHNKAVSTPDNTTSIPNNTIPTQSNNNFLSSVPEKTTEKFHRVQANETLFSIAKRYRITVEDLRKWNKLEQSQTIKVGQKLIISEPVQSVNNNIVHKVRKGESLSIIAQQYHVDIQLIKKKNNLKTDRILPGQKLIIPS